MKSKFYIITLMVITLSVIACDMPESPSPLIGTRWEETSSGFLLSDDIAQPGSIYTFEETRYQWYFKIGQHQTFYEVLDCDITYSGNNGFTTSNCVYGSFRLQESSRSAATANGYYIFRLYGENNEKMGVIWSNGYSPPKGLSKQEFEPIRPRSGQEVEPI